MKHFFILIFFTLFLSLSVFSQADTTSLTKKNKFGCSIFGGLGAGGNSLKQGFAYGLSARAHYKIHTLNIYYSLATKSEQFYGKGYEYALYSSCYGATYGVGLYTDVFTASIGVGIGRFQTSAKLWSKTPAVHIWDTYYYDNISFCIGAQGTMLINKQLGLTFQTFLNSSKQITNWTALFGLEINIW